VHEKITHARNRLTSEWLSRQVPAWLLLLVLVVSVAGILLLRRTDPTAELLVEMASLQQAHEKAIDVLEQAVKKEPGNETYRLSLARVYGSAGQRVESISQYEKLVEIEPASVWYHEEMGHQYIRLGDYDRALAQYQEMLGIDPNSWQASCYQGNVYRELETYDEANEQYQQA
jgi:tetratricopeptide (TPR) repeat protein